MDSKIGTNDITEARRLRAAELRAFAAALPNGKDGLLEDAAKVIEEQQKEIATKTEVFAHAMNLAAQHRDELEQQNAALKAACEVALVFLEQVTYQGPRHTTVREQLRKALEVK